MKYRFMWPLVLVLVCGLAAARQQDEEGEGDNGEAQEETEESGESADDEVISATEELLRAIRLPEAADRVRRAGVSREEVKQVLEHGRTAGVPPAEMERVFEVEAESAEEYGPVDNFGAFVRSQLDKGLRGRDLAAAIHREHAARGRGKLRTGAPPGSRGKGKGNGGSPGKSEDRDGGQGRDRGRPDNRSNGTEADTDSGEEVDE